MGYVRAAATAIWLTAGSLGANDVPTIGEFLRDLCDDIDDRGCQIFVITVKSAYEEGYQAAKYPNPFSPARMIPVFCVPPLVSAKALAAVGRIELSKRPIIAAAPAASALAEAWAREFPCGK